MQPAPDTDAPDRGGTSDALEILQLLNRYGQALDAHDWSALESVFAEDAEADYASIAGSEHGDAHPVGRARIVAWLATALAPRRGTFHFMTNHVVDLDGDTATSRHYMHNRNLSLCGTYHCSHIRTAEGWRIASLRLEERILDPAGVDEGRDQPDGTRPPGVVERLTEVADRLELHELGPRYAHLIDEPRWEDLHTIFTDDAVADYTSIGGAGALLEGRVAIRSWLQRHLGNRADAVPWHYVTDTVVTLRGDGASCRSYMHNRLLHIIGVYETKAVRTAAGWRYTRLRLAAKTMPAAS